jgi:hypothetical protein
MAQPDIPKQNNSLDVVTHITMSAFTMHVAQAADTLIAHNAPFIAFNKSDSSTQ